MIAAVMFDINALSSREPWWQPSRLTSMPSFFTSMCNHPVNHGGSHQAWHQCAILSKTTMAAAKLDIHIGIILRKIMAVVMLDINALLSRGPWWQLSSVTSMCYHLVGHDGSRQAWHKWYTIPWATKAAVKLDINVQSSREPQWQPVRFT